ncbi:MAG: hypothetical protein WC326_08560 [Candidatus Delongbacteria bacterium]
MATGSATQSTNRVFLGGFTMRIEAIGADFWCGWSNAIDVQHFATSLMLSCWVSGETFTGAASLKAEVHFFSVLGTDLGSEVVWADHAGLSADFTQYMAQVKKSAMPAGTRFIRLRFGITDGVGMATGVAYVDAVQAVPGEWLPAWTPSLLVEGTTLDAIADGSTYGRVRKTALDGTGQLDLASTGIKNRGALALKDMVSSKEIDKDAVTSAVIQDGAVIQTKLGALAVGTSQLANSAVTSTKIGSGAVGATQLASSVSSLTKVSGGILTGSGNVATLPSGKTLNAAAGVVMLKTFTSMPTVSQVIDGEWFAVTMGGSRGIYVRSGTTAFNGAGIESGFSS